MLVHFLDFKMSSVLMLSISLGWSTAMIQSWLQSGQTSTFTPNEVPALASGQLCVWTALVRTTVNFTPSW